MVAGDTSSGTIKIRGEVVNDLEPKDRGIAMVFQNYALYPHMTIFENMAFGLRIAKKEDVITETVNRTAKALGLEKMLARKPQALSGRQCQRVALGRAIVRNPKVFLFDEPSNPSLAGMWARRSFLAFGLGSVIARIQGDHIFHLGEKVPVQLDLDKVTLFDPSTENVIK